MTCNQKKAWRMVFMGIVASGFFWLWTNNSLAQEKEVTTAGKNVYNQNCAVCHGREGKGDGGAVSLLTVKPADLTQIAKKNGGAFPFWKVYRIIDGREEVKHADLGTRISSTSRVRHSRGGIRSPGSYFRACLFPTIDSG